MPIAGLSDNGESFIKIGQIRKGMKEQVEKIGDDGKPYMVERMVNLDYFRVTFHKSLVDIPELFRASYGDKPTELRVKFSDPDIDKVWDVNYECYKKGGLIAKAGSTKERGNYWIFLRDYNGDNSVIIRDEMPVTDLGRRTPPPDPSKPLWSYKNKDGKDIGCYLEPVGRLKVIIPEVAKAIVGYLEFRAESTIDIRNIDQELRSYARNAANIGKTLLGLPFILRRRDEEHPCNINGKMVMKSLSVVHLDLDSKWASRALAVQENQALPLLPAQDQEIPDDFGDSGDVLEGEILPPEPSPSPLDPRTAAAAEREASINPQPAENDPMIDPMTGAWVEWAALQWNISKADAAKNIASKGLGNSVPLSQFKKIVQGG